LDVSICHAGATSDYFLLFFTLPLKHKLEQIGFLAPGLCLFGDNAYVNTHYMATPFKGVTGGSNDAYNFYQSQICILVECSFGMLVHHWGVVLRKVMSSAYGLSKTTALVMCVCCLHNNCIDAQYGNTAQPHSVVPPTVQDLADIYVNGGIPLDYRNNNSPDQLLHGGEHFNAAPPPSIIADIRLRQERQGKTVCCPGTFSMK
jgi:hypothetical protein